MTDVTPTASAYETALEAIRAVPLRTLASTDHKLAYAQVWATLAVAEAQRGD